MFKLKKSKNIARLSSDTIFIHRPLQFSIKPYGQNMIAIYTWPIIVNQMLKVTKCKNKSRLEYFDRGNDNVENQMNNSLNFQGSNNFEATNCKEKHFSRYWSQQMQENCRRISAPPPNKQPPTGSMSARMRKVISNDMAKANCSSKSKTILIEDMVFE